MIGHVGGPTAVVVIWNVALPTYAPSTAASVTLTELGTLAAGWLLLSATLKVPAAAPTSETVPVVDCPPSTELLANVSEGAPVALGGGGTVMSAVFCTPLKAAVICEQPLASAGTAKVLLLSCLRLDKVTDAGTVATVGALLVSCTVTLPLTGATSSFTVPVALAPVATCAGDNVRLASATA